MAGDPGDPSSLHVVVTDPRGRAVADAGLARWLERVAPSRAAGTVAIALAADAVVRRLNRAFAGQDRPTDVLSFPAHEPRAGEAKRQGTDRPRRAARTNRDAVHLGDIVIATGVARRQAREAGHSLATELRVLALHGLLHLLGYDHHADRGRMARVERRLRRKGALREGLIERGGRLAFRGRARAGEGGRG